jgi:lysozyme
MTIHEMIRKHEGLSLVPYRCPAGKMTIGYGWNIEAHPLPTEIASCLRITGKITLQMAEELLDISIGAATRDCQAIYAGFDQFTETRQAALADFMLNVGATTAIKFKRMRAAIEAGDWPLAADEMVYSNWFRQVGERGPEIMDLVRQG